MSEQPKEGKTPFTRLRKRVEIPEYHTTVQPEAVVGGNFTALDTSDATMDVSASIGDAVSVPSVFIPPPGAESVYGVVWVPVRNAMGNGWQRVEIAIPLALLEQLPHKKHEFDRANVVHALSNEFFQNVIEDRIGPEYFER